MVGSPSPISPLTRAHLYGQLRIAIAVLRDESVDTLVKQVAWAGAAKALEHLDDERSFADALRAAHGAVEQGDEDLALLVLSAIGRCLPENGIALLRLGERACARGMHGVAVAAACELAVRGLPVPSAWPLTWVGSQAATAAGVTSACAVGEEAEGYLDRPDMHTVRSIVRATFARIAEANAPRSAAGTYTGYGDYDQLTGGLLDGEVTILAGRPGMGVTSLALNVALRVASSSAGEAQDVQTARPGILIFSLGTPRTLIVNRLLSILARIDGAKARSGMLTSQDWKQLTGAAGQLAALNIWVQDDPAFAMDDIRDAAARTKAEFERSDAAGCRTHRIGLIVVDDWHRIRRRRDVRRRLRDVARELMTPILATAELSAVDGQDLDRRRPQLADLPIGDDDADTVTFLHRDDYYRRETPTGLAEWIVAWQRHGPPDVVTLRWDPGCGRFEGLAGER